MKKASIVGIQFGIMSPEQIRRASVAKITSKDTYINNRPVVNGIFDPRMGVLDPGFICPTDGSNYIDCPGYFGHIDLVRPVFYIQYLSQIIKILRCICLRCSKLLCNKLKHQHLLKLSRKERWAYVFEQTSKIKRCGDENEDGCGYLKAEKIKKDGIATITAEWASIDDTKIIKKLSAELIHKIFKRISDDDVDFMGFSSIYSRPEWMICQALAIPPPCVRPSVKHDAQQRSEDDLSHIIISIIKANQQLTDKIKNNADPASI